MGEQDTQAIIANIFGGDDAAALAFARGVISKENKIESGTTTLAAQGVPNQEDRKRAHQPDTTLSTSTTKKASREVPNKEKPGSSIATSHSAIATMAPKGRESWSAYSAFAKGQSTMRSPEGRESWSSHSAFATGQSTMISSSLAHRVCTNSSNRCLACAQYVHDQGITRDEHAQVHTRYEGEAQGKHRKQERMRCGQQEIKIKEGA